jgi:hypothetical protein
VVHVNAETLLVTRSVRQTNSMPSSSVASRWATAPWGTEDVSLYAV